MNNKILFITSKGYVGTADGMAEVGDQISIVKGASVPVILRTAGSFQDLPEHMRGKLVEAGAEYKDKEFFTKVGTAYVNGIMDGEVMDVVDRGEEKMETIYLV
jgi:hypothetical protein